MTTPTKPAIHPTAEVSPRANVGAGTRIWRDVQVREGATIGANCTLGKGAYVDFDVSIGDNVKIQNGASVFHGCTLEDGVFIGPHACLTNDRFPRAVNPDGTLKSADDWEVSPTRVREGAAIGAGAILLAGITVGRWALVGAGAVVTRDVGDFELVVGNPAKAIGKVCPSAHRLKPGAAVCQQCGWRLPGGD